MKKSVIIPVFNEEGNIGELIKKTKLVLNPDDELILVDDGSSDNTAKEIRENNCILISC